MGRKAVRASTICARRLPRSLQGQGKESLSCCGEGFTLWREVLEIKEIALKVGYPFYGCGFYPAPFFAELRADLRANREFFYYHIARLNLGCIFVFCGVFLFCLEGIFCGARVAEFFCRFFCGDFEVSRGKASRNVLTPVRPCEHEKSVADNESGGFLSGAIFIAFAYGNSRSFYSSRGAKSGGAVFFPLSKKKEKFSYSAQN